MDFTKIFVFRTFQTEFLLFVLDLLEGSTF